VKFQEDFIKEEGIEKKIKGRKFLLKEFTGQETDDMTNTYIKVIDEDRLDINIKARNEYLLKYGVLDAPYTNVEGKEFHRLNPDERIAILQKLKPAIRNELIQALMEINGLKKEVEEENQKK